MTSGLKNFDIDPAVLDPNGVAENQTDTAAFNLALDGAQSDLGTALQWDIGDVYGSDIAGAKLEVDSAGDISSVVFTFTGKDQYGNAQTETVTGVTTTAVSTTKFYSQVTVIAADAAVGSNVFVGIATGGLVSRIMPLNSHSQVPAVVAVTGLSGTCQFNLQETFENIGTDGPAGAEWFNVVENATTDIAAQCSLGATAVRCQVNSYSDTAELQFKVAYNPYR
jgi:hypothetical protein